MEIFIDSVLLSGKTAFTGGKIETEVIPFATFFPICPYFGHDVQPNPAFFTQFGLAHFLRYEL